MRPIHTGQQLADFYRPLPPLIRGGALFEDLVRAVYEAPGVLPAAGWAVDGGANKGLHTLPMAAQCERVIAFEPHPGFARALRPKLPANVTLLEMALANETRNRTFFMANVAGGNALTIYPGTEDVKRRTETVLGVRLDDVLAPDRLDFIKLDLDGYDFPALKGARRLIETHKPTIVFEFGRERTAQSQGFTAAEFFGFFAALGYDLFDICGVPFVERWWSNRVWLPWDMIALPEGRDTAAIKASLDQTLRRNGFDPPC